MPTEENPPPYKHHDYVRQLVAGFAPITDEEMEKLALIFSASRRARRPRDPYGAGVEHSGA